MEFTRGNTKRNKEKVQGFLRKVKSAADRRKSEPCVRQPQLYILRLTLLEETCHLMLIFFELKKKIFFVYQEATDTAVPITRRTKGLLFNDFN